MGYVTGTEEIVTKQDKILKILKGVYNRGGYRLCRAPEDITAGEVLRATEGELAPVSCLECGAKPCSRAAYCKTLPMWKEYYRLTNEYFDNISLADLLGNEAPGDYVI